jgi:hypothetical protein
MVPQLSLGRPVLNYSQPARKRKRPSGELSTGLVGAGLGAAAVGAAAYGVSKGISQRDVDVTRPLEQLSRDPSFGSSQEDYYRYLDAASSAATAKPFGAGVHQIIKPIRSAPGSQFPWTKGDEQHYIESAKGPARTWLQITRERSDTGPAVEKLFSEYVTSRGFQSVDSVPKDGQVPLIRGFYAHLAKVDPYTSAKLQRDVDPSWVRKPTLGYGAVIRAFRGLKEFGSNYGVPLAAAGAGLAAIGLLLKYRRRKKQEDQDNLATATTLTKSAESPLFQSHSKSTDVERGRELLRHALNPSRNRIMPYQAGRRVNMTKHLPPEKPEFPSEKAASVTPAASVGGAVLGGIIGLISSNKRNRLKSILLGAGLGGLAGAGAGYLGDRAVQQAEAAKPSPPAEPDPSQSPQQQANLEHATQMADYDANAAAAAADIDPLHRYSGDRGGQYAARDAGNLGVGALEVADMSRVQKVLPGTSKALSAVDQLPAKAMSRIPGATRLAPWLGKASLRKVVPGLGELITYDTSSGRNNLNEFQKFDSSNPVVAARLMNPANAESKTDYGMNLVEAGMGASQYHPLFLIPKLLRLGAADLHTTAQEGVQATSREMSTAGRSDPYLGQTPFVAPATTVGRVFTAPAAAAGSADLSMTDPTNFAPGVGLYRGVKAGVRMLDGSGFGNLDFKPADTAGELNKGHRVSNLQDFTYRTTGQGGLRVYDRKSGKAFAPLKGDIDRVFQGPDRVDAVGRLKTQGVLPEQFE